MLWLSKLFGRSTATGGPKPGVPETATQQAPRPQGASRSTEKKPEKMGTDVSDKAIRKTRTEYFDCTPPNGNGRCSDNACPCPEVEIPRGKGYLFISQELVDFRRQYPGEEQAGAAMESRLRGDGFSGGAYSIGPVLVCEQGAKLRNLDLKVAAGDAAHWWATGKVPLRATPISAQQAGSPTCDASGSDVFFSLCRTGQAGDIRAAIAAGADVNAKNKEGNTPLFDAAFHNPHCEAIAALLKAGANVNATNAGGVTPLMSAAMHSNSNVIDTLVKAGALVTATLSDGSTPLWTAASFNPDSRVIEALLKAGADVDAKRDDGVTPLMAAAARTASRDVLEALVTAGAKVDATNVSGATALMFAASQNTNPAVIGALVNAGADVNARDANDWTPLMCAAARNPIPAIVVALVEAGADMNATDKSGNTPLMHAACYSSNPDVIYALLSAGADVNAANSSGASALMHAAAQNGNPEVAVALVSAGADMAAKDQAGNSVREYAQQSKAPRVYDRLLQAGGQVNSQGNECTNGAPGSRDTQQVPLSTAANNPNVTHDDATIVTEGGAVLTYAITRTSPPTECDARSLLEACPPNNRQFLDAHGGCFFILSCFKWVFEQQGLCFTKGGIPPNDQVYNILSRGVMSMAAEHCRKFLTPETKYMVRAMPVSSIMGSQGELAMAMFVVMLQKVPN